MYDLPVNGGENSHHVVEMLYVGLDDPAWAAGGGDYYPLVVRRVSYPDQVVVFPFAGTSQVGRC